MKRYSLELGSYGMFFRDNIKEKNLTLNNVCEMLNVEMNTFISKLLIENERLEKEVEKLTQENIINDDKLYKIKEFLSGRD